MNAGDGSGFRLALERTTTTLGEIAERRRTYSIQALDGDGTADGERAHHGSKLVPGSLMAPHPPQTARKQEAHLNQRRLEVERRTVGRHRRRRVAGPFEDPAPKAAQGRVFRGPLDGGTNGLARPVPVSTVEELFQSADQINVRRRLRWW